MRAKLLRLIALLLSMACGALAQAQRASGDEMQGTHPADDVEIRFVAEVPEGTSTLFITGSLPEWGPWMPGRMVMNGEGRVRQLTMRIQRGAEIEFKFSLGSWQTEALAEDGTVPPNYLTRADVDKEFRVVIPGFKSGFGPMLDTLEEAGALGDRLVAWRDVESSRPIHSRTVLVWLPTGYDTSDRRYPVLYMHDGQNLFDPRTANTGVDWGVDETVEALVQAGKIGPMIVVGMYCTEDRYAEYSPFERADDYIAFITEELKPRVDAEFRTMPGPETTGVMGSSMGGLVSLRAAMTRPDVFSRAGCISTHWPWNEGKTVGLLREAGSLPRSVRFYFDYGTEGIDATYEPHQLAVNALLDSWGWKQPGDFLVRKFDGATHNEAAWRERLAIPFEYLFADWPK